jgi:hypothetical protein
MAARTRKSGYNLLGIYLNDHLAGATAGVELARRATAASSEPAQRDTVQALAADIAEDRESFLKIMRNLGIPVRTYKVYAAWLGEKAGRLKFNGYLMARSPLSGLEELEMLRLGVEGKAAGWRTLRRLADKEMQLSSGHLDELISRARQQADILEELRIRAADRIIAGERS